MSTSRTAMVLAATALLGLATANAVTTSAQRRVTELDAALGTAAASHASALDEYFERARSIDLLMARNPSFAAFLAAPGDRTTKLDTRAADVRHIEEALGYLEQLYPGSIGEACFIDRTGAEVARVVRGDVAPREDLSTEEAAAPFFAPAFRRAPGQVYQSLPYVSPDTEEWVISNATPLSGSGQGADAIVHYEVTLASFARIAGASSERYGVRVVDVASGAVVADSRRAVSGEEELPRAGGSLLRAIRTAADEASRSHQAEAVDLDGDRAVVLPVARTADNANEWAVVLSAPRPSALGSGLGAVGLAPVAMALGAVLLLVLAAAQQRASRRSLEHASLHDELTGLPNRRLLSLRLEEALRAGSRRGERCGVLVLDLDRFKEVNDTLGHHYGDRLLQEVAGRLKGVLRPSDTLARLGGDEFAVLLPGLRDADEAVATAQRVLAAVETPFLVDDVSLDVECSTGIATAPDHGYDPQVLMRCADVAMYEAKQSMAGYEVYEPQRDSHTPTRLALLGDLRRALVSPELFLHYQPKVDVPSGRLSGVEALLRWAHPTRGLVPPGDFIPVAEGTGLIRKITARTLEMAVEDAAAWAREGRPLQVAVNLSARALLDAGLPMAVADLLAEHGLPAHLLRLELTESAVMTDPEHAMEVLTALREVGVLLSIDDFGTGYSSMAYLKRLPVDELKVDRSFVQDMLVDGNDAVLVRSAVDLGHNLGLTVVAEGVEDAATLDALGELGCDLAQGFHLARPMTADALERWRAAAAPGSAPSAAGGTPSAVGVGAAVEG